MNEDLVSFLNRHLASILVEDHFYNRMFKLSRKLHELVANYGAEFDRELERKIRLCRAIDAPLSIKQVSDLISECETVLNNIKERFYSKLKRISFNMYSKRVNEPVRLGIYRTLFIELYNRVYGVKNKTRLDMLTYHGVFREYLKIINMANFESSKNIHTGLDLVFFIRTSYDNGKRIVLPLIIVGKYDEKEAKKVMLYDAVKHVLSQTDRNSREYMALQYIPYFTRIALLKIKELLERINAEECMVGEINHLMTYNDFLCSILYPVFVDIPRLYNKIIYDEKLRKLTRLGLEDWIKALLRLSSEALIPVAPTIIESEKPPDYPDGGSVLAEIIKLLGVKTRELRIRMDNDIKKIVLLYQQEAAKLYREYEGKLDRILKIYGEKLRELSEKLKLKQSW